MNICINPNCTQQQNREKSFFCQNCGSELLIVGQYRVKKRLSKKGDLGRTYEVLDDRTVKIMKILTKNHPEVVKLFQREAEILSQINCEGIPKGDGYFKYFPANSKIPLHCLVMEKIEGMDLEEYQKHRENLPLGEIVAFKWFKQLVGILEKLHSYNLFNRDINPSNIILRPDGQIVLIDFGALRQVTVVGEGQLSTKIYTPGYSAPEQEKGNGVNQSDFYALGRTFVYLLTGKSPIDIGIENIAENQLKWRKYAREDLDRDFANLIEILIQEKADLRPNNTREILERIDKIEAKINQKKAIEPQKTLIASATEPKKVIATRIIPEPEKEELPILSVEKIQIPSHTIEGKNDISTGGKNPVINLIIAVIFSLGLGLAISQLLMSSIETNNSSNIAETREERKEGVAFNEQWISSGDRVLFRGRGNRFRDLGIAAFKEKQYDEAVEFFTKGVQSNRNDPEVQIYLNNAKARLAGNPFKIATVVPIDSRQTSAAEILRGVADAQTKFNTSGGIYGRLVEVLIADDGNKPQKAAAIASVIAKNPQILGVVGHNSSSATLAALDRYQKAGITVISPTSSSTELKSEIFFRTILSDFESGRKLATYAKNELKINKIAVFYNEDSTYSKSLLQAFKNNFEKNGGKIEIAIDMSDRNLNPTQEIEALRSQVEAIALFPNTASTSVAISLARANQEIPGEKFQLLGGDALYSSDTLKLGRSAVNGLILAIPWFPQEQPYAKRAASRWLGTINWRTATSYDATIAVLSSLSEGANRSSVLDRLGQIRISPEATSGELLRFTPTGERQGEPVLVKVSEDMPNRPTGVEFGFKLIAE